MSLRPENIFPVPLQTAQVAQAAFPLGNRYMSLRDKLGTIYEDALTGYPQTSTAQPCPQISGYTLTNTYTVTTTPNPIKPSDGRVLIDTQKVFLGVSAANQVELSNNSHMQERNSPELKMRSGQLFRGSFGPLFQITN